MASFSAGTTFTDGVANDVTAVKLAALVNAATPTSGLIQDRTAETTIASNDTLLVGDASDSNNLKRMTVANFAGTLPTATITSGTITTLNSTTGTITTGVIPTLTSTTLVTTGTGTAASPAIVPTGDTNTGIFFPAADTIAFAEGGTEAMRIDSNGNVGIGTTSPDTKLHVDQGNTDNGITVSVDNGAYKGRVYYDYATNDFVIDSNGDVDFRQAAGTNNGTGNLAFRTALGSGIGGTGASTEKMRITGGGNVGIGTTSPISKIHIGSDVANSGFATTFGAIICGSGQTGRGMSDGGNNNSSLLLKSISGEVGDGGALLLGATSGHNRYYAAIKGFLVNGNNNTSGDICFSVRPTTTDTSLSEALRIDSGGGITIAGLAGSGSRAVNASAAGALSAASDASLKEEVVGASIAGLNEILQIHPKMYRWKEDIANRGDEASVELGFIANDVAPIIPSAAPIGNDGLYGFYDRSITAALVKAVQELSAKVTALEAA